MEHEAEAESDSVSCTNSAKDMYKRRCKICKSKYRAVYETWYLNPYESYAHMSWRASEEWDIEADKPKYGENISKETFRRHFIMHYLPRILNIEHEFKAIKHFAHTYRDQLKMAYRFLNKQLKLKLKDANIPQEQSKTFFLLKLKLDKEFRDTWTYITDNIK